MLKNKFWLFVLLVMSMIIAACGSSPSATPTLRTTEMRPTQALEPTPIETCEKTISENKLWGLTGVWMHFVEINDYLLVETTDGTRYCFPPITPMGYAIDQITGLSYRATKFEVGQNFMPGNTADAFVGM